MSGVYGNVLLAWCEQQRSATVFDMKPKINGGFEVVKNSERLIIGIFQNSHGKEIRASNGNLIKTNGLELWTSEENLDGLFVKWNETIYRIKGSNDWSFEGGFIKYGLEKVVGNNGTEHDKSTWNTGYNSFG